MRPAASVETPDAKIEIEFVPEPLPATEDDLGSGLTPASQTSVQKRAASARGAFSAATTELQGSTDGTTQILVAEGDGLARPLGSIHGGFQQMGAADMPAPDVKKDAPVNLSERGTKALRDPLYERDRSLGLGPDGPVIQALETSAQASTAPTDGRAVFDVVIGGDGMVASLTVSEGGVAWNGVARDALAAVRGKKARIPDAAKNGVALKIEITSSVSLPSGAKPGTGVDLAGIPLKKGGGDKSPRISILNPIPKITAVPVDREGKITIPTVSLDVISVANGDLGDIGARPRRVIHAKTLDQHVL